MSLQSQPRITSFEWCGQLSYQTGLEQQDLAQAHVACTLQGRVLGLEHTPVVTLGKRGRSNVDLKESPQTLQREGFEVMEIGRGGHATLHSPGQLVIYPMLPLREWRIGVREFVESLEATTMAFLAEFGIEAQRRGSEPGLYTDQGKIAFFGIRVSQGISSHGLSINVGNDLTLFSRIRSCGREMEKFDRMADYGVSASLKELFSCWNLHFLKTFRLTDGSQLTNLGPS